MIRFVILICLLMVSPAWAQYWQTYENTRFGYLLDIPPGYAGDGESANGDGQVFYAPGAGQGVTVWGGHLLEDFAAEVRGAQARAEADQWALSDQTITPQWAYFVGRRDARQFYQRHILLCDGTSFAAFRAEYAISDLGAMGPLIEGMVRSFVSADCPGSD